MSTWPQRVVTAASVLLMAASGHSAAAGPATAPSPARQSAACTKVIRTIAGLPLKITTPEASEASISAAFDAAEVRLHPFGAIEGRFGALVRQVQQGIEDFRTVLREDGLEAAEEAPFVSSLSRSIVDMLLFCNGT
jgi:hypothetical protein